MPSVSHSGFLQNAGPLARIGAELLFVALTIAALFAINAVLERWKRQKEDIAESWPSVEANVQFVSVTPVFDTTYFRASIDYSYFVDEYRSGTYTRDFDTENEADNFAEALKDKKVPIHYNPKNPDKSLLEDEDMPVDSSTTLGLNLNRSKFAP